MVDELRRLERTRRQAQAEVQSGGTATAGDWLLSLLADVTGKPRSVVRPESTMQELGLDSLSFAELGVALEAAGVQVPENVDITSIVSVPELRKRLPSGVVANRSKRRPRKRPKEGQNESTDDRLVLPDWLVRAGNRGLNAGQRALYERVLKRGLRAKHTCQLRDGLSSLRTTAATWTWGL